MRRLPGHHFGIDRLGLFRRAGDLRPVGPFERWQASGDAHAGACRPGPVAGAQRQVAGRALQLREIRRVAEFPEPRRLGGIGVDGDDLRAGADVVEMQVLHRLRRVQHHLRRPERRRRGPRAPDEFLPHAPVEEDDPPAPAHGVVSRAGVSPPSARSAAAAATCRLPGHGLRLPGLVHAQDAARSEKGHTPPLVAVLRAPAGGQAGAGRACARPEGICPVRSVPVRSEPLGAA